MGSKGSQVSNTSQQQTYSPAGAGYITNALNTAQNAAQLPFNIPQAPVAGFSGLQNQAFGQIGQGANLANPYYAQAGQLYGQAAQAPNVSAFYNPEVGAVTSQLQNIFGQQNAQNTAQLTQAAGGVGADRIAIGQGNLANQQGLAAGQVYSQLYGQAQAAAQQQQQAQMQAAAGLGNVGAGMQSAALSGGNALLGAGGLQQQLSQAQLNSPYQQQLAAAAFPYQQSQFLTGAVGALAPGLGGTTSGQGQTTSQYNPSIWGQIGGGLGALAGVGGYLGGSGKGSNPSYGGGNMFSGDAYGGSGANPLPGLTAADYGPGFAGGGGASDEPIDVAPSQVIPATQLRAIPAHIPNLNLNPPQQQQSQSGGSGLGAILSGAAKLAPMLMGMGSGGAVPNPFADHNAAHHRRMNNIFSGKNPYAGEFADGGDVDTSPIRHPLPTGPVSDAERAMMGLVQPEPYRLAGPAAMDAWRNDTPLPNANGSPSAPIVASDAETPDEVKGTSKVGASTDTPVSVATSGTQNTAAAADTGPSLAGFLKSPWAALTLGGLEAMRTGSLASGFGQTLKTYQGQETADQAAQRLAQEAKFRQAELDKPPTGYDYATDNTMQAIPGGPADPAVVAALTSAKTGSGLLGPDARQFIAESYLAGDKSALSGLGYGNVGSQNRAAVMGDITRMAQERGISGSQLAAIKADYAASTAGARTSAVQSARIDSAIQEARSTFPLALAASQAVQRGDWVPLNQLEQAAQKAGSNSALAKFSAANQAVVTAYASAMTRGASVIPVDARRHAEMLLSTAMSPEAYRAVIGQLELEMQAAKSAPEAVRQQIMDHISGRTSAAAPAAAAPAQAAAPDRGAIEAEMRRRGLLP